MSAPASGGEVFAGKRSILVQGLSGGGRSREGNHHYFLREGIEVPQKIEKVRF